MLKEQCEEDINAIDVLNKVCTKVNIGTRIAI